jgi:hypothetical protein
MTSDLSSFLESLLFTIPEDSPQELHDASTHDFSPEFQDAAQSFLSGFREYLATNYPDIYEREYELDSSFGGNVYFSLSEHGCGFWDDRDSELGRAYQDALEAYSGNKYRFEELACMLSVDDAGKVDLAILPEYLAEYRRKFFTV